MVNISEIIEEGSSSSSSHDHNNNHKQQQQRYDVFLSFRGADTRLRFTAHLFDALVNADISTFFDDEEIQTGEELKPELEDAIGSSRTSVIVLSENYAASTWCLDELALILERRRVSDHVVIPIFYHVEPTDVRKQQKSFGDAMRKHRKKMKKERNAEKKVKWGEKIDRWCKALREVADLKGKQIMKDRREPDSIEDIVTEILQRLGVPLSDTLPLLIGRNHDIKEITSWLTDGSSSSMTTADILTVLGMGGIGKTSLAKYVFHLHSRTFAKSCFIEGINLRCTGNYNGLLDVQKQLYGDISNKNKLPVHDTCAYTSKIEKALARVKVFLVLDDIDSLKQLDALLGNKGFHPGSKIIITTRNASLTEGCALYNLEVKPKHKTLKVESLHESAARELLCLHAFKCKDPKEGYEEVIEKLVKYCQGHPLALEVLGRSLHNKDTAYWDNSIRKLKKESHLDIRKVLQMSFDSLPSPNDMELFKHIACFFNGMEREISEQILEACDIYAISGIPNLIERCLLSIDQRGNRLMMHQLLQEMGKAVVREESPDEPGKRSLLWCHDESFKVLKRKKGTDRVKGLVFDPRMLEKEKFHEPWHLNTDGFSNMDNLRILHLNYVQLSGSYEHFPEELVWLRMHGFPLKSIPSDIPVEKLVVLDMSYSNIESFGTCCTTWQKVIGLFSKDKIILGSLKILDLSYCEQLRKLGGFYKLPALERLIVRNCVRLIEICESLEECVELVHIDLSYCVKLEKFPTAIHKLKKGCKLLLDGCNTRESILRELVPSVPSSLVRLSLAGCNLTNESFPMDMSCLSRLKYLRLDRNPIVSMPDCVRSLCSLEELSMFCCKTLISVEHPPCTLKRLDVWMIDMPPVLERISFDPDMSPMIGIDINASAFRPWSYEVEGMVKIQALEGVEEKVLSALGWTPLLLLDFPHMSQQVVTLSFHDFLRGRDGQFQIQMYYEFGIFSTFYGGRQLPMRMMMMPDWIWSNVISSSPQEEIVISFTIPSSPNKQLKGLNLCYVVLPDGPMFYLPTIEISNKTKNHSWIYEHCLYKTIEVGEGGEWVTYISHWMFGMNEMEAGDHIIITFTRKWHQVFDQECGVGFVYEEEDEEEEEDVLEYYKSWNHIIGGDLSSFQLQTGEYLLDHREFTRFVDAPLRWGKYAGIRYKGAVDKVCPLVLVQKCRCDIDVPLNNRRDTIGRRLVKLLVASKGICVHIDFQTSSLITWITDKNTSEYTLFKVHGLWMYTPKRSYNLRTDSWKWQI